MAFAASLALVTVDAQAQPDCPDSLDVSKVLAPPGWEILGADETGAARPRLRHVTFTDGHPREKAFLRPTSNRSTANGDRTDVYMFSPVSKDGIWLVCQYAGMRQSLSRPITATMCEVTENERPENADSRVRGVVCQ